MPPRLKPTRLEYVVDGVRMRAQLSAAALEAAGDGPGQRKAALEILKAALFRGRMIAKERLENGAGGIETARLLSGVTDEVITALWDFTTVHVFRARNPTEGERVFRETCAQCHALRAHIAEGYTAGAPLLEFEVVLDVRPAG